MVSPTLNFLTRGTKVEVRNGYAAVAAEIMGNGFVPGLFTAHKWDGTEIVFLVRGTSLFYLDDPTQTILEVGLNILAGTKGEHIWMAEYSSPAGAQLWVSSRYTDLLKIMTANPVSAVSQYDATKNFKGSLRIKTNRMRLWNYPKSGNLGTATRNTLQVSYVDSENYTTITSEALAGLTGTLAKGSNAKATVFAVQIFIGAETFTDDYLGNLVGSLGGTGTINYATGAYVITSTGGSGSVTATYQYEDSTNKGIADFTHDSPRVIGQGVSFLQNEGGAILDCLTLNGSEYVLHERNAWLLTIPPDDSQSSQIIFREHLSLASENGAVATADGIYYVDTTNTSRPYIAVIQYSPISQLAYPRDLSSEILDLSGYVFDQCVAFEWGSYILFACRTTNSTVNNRIILLNTEISNLSKGPIVFDIVDFFANCFCIKNGALLAGDSATQSLYNLFANFDDDGAIPNAIATFGIDNLGILTLKKVKRLWIEGEIAVSQKVNVNISQDRGGFVNVGVIDGSAGYVDKGGVTVGSHVVGLYPVGGGDNGVIAYHYLIELIIRMDKFKDRQIQFVPQGIGYFSVSEFVDDRITYHQDKLPRRYRAAV